MGIIDGVSKYPIMYAVHKISRRSVETSMVYDFPCRETEWSSDQTNNMYINPGSNESLIVILNIRFLSIYYCGNSFKDDHRGWRDHGATGK